MNKKEVIQKLSEKIKPYVKSDEIKKEIIDGMGKYLTTSYRIFQGSFKPDKEKITAATTYFVNMIKKSKGSKPEEKFITLRKKYKKISRCKSTCLLV